MDIVKLKHHVYLVVAGLAFLLILPAYAYAQLFSPGNLSTSHAELDSLSRCDACHSSQNSLDSNKCLACHTLIKARRQAGKGYHGQGDAVSDCANCHSEHKGRGARLIEWLEGSEAEFDHSRTGWPLTGMHATLSCTKCHRLEFIIDPAVKKRLADHPRKHTKLGLSSTCTSCHFDEHRGQLGQKCNSCHTPAGFTAVKNFNHSAVWELEGAHATVNCSKCHSQKQDTTTPSTVLPAPRSKTYRLYKPIPHSTCTDCHTDPHKGRFGENCLSCHTKQSFTINSDAGSIAFHDKTSFPLRGRHQKIACARCHQQKANGKRHYKPILHDRCSSCHPSAHPDFPDTRMQELDCKSCHSVDGFKPVNYSFDRHGQTNFPLAGAHRAVACPDCHLQNLGRPVKNSAARHVRGKLAMRVRSQWRLAWTKAAPPNCNDCHGMPHRDQFGAKPCLDCHTNETWRNRSSFNHGPTAFPLEGEHKKLACEYCHRETEDESGTFVKYAPIEHDRCDACHYDPHMKQFQLLTPKKICSDCHTVQGFKPSRFDHDDALDERSWPLKGRHRRVECLQCHKTVDLGDSLQAIQYRDTPRKCNLCHEDAHAGAYRAASNLIVGQSTDMAERETRCETCHTEQSWHSVIFRHSSVGYTLKGLHASAACTDCHTPGSDQPPSRNCADCHRDPHGAFLGFDCAECHSESGFSDAEIHFSKHNLTGFPLIGAHAVIACNECHRDVRDIAFNRTPSQCVACHSSRRPTGAQASVDHSAFSENCGDCHTPISWTPAAFLDHGRCFPIGRGSEHSGLSCSECHIGSTSSATNSCNTGTVSCVRCHGCESEEHRRVNGFECKDQKCYRCHPAGE